MNRRSFFKFLGIGAATAAVAPKVVALMSNEEDFFTSLDGKLSVFEKARKGYDYSIGVETGNGVGTPSVFSVMRIGNENEPCVQVAEYMSHDEIQMDFAENIRKVSYLYQAVCKDLRGPMLVIEQISVPGDTVQAQLKIMGLTRFYKAVNSKGIKRDGWYSTKFSGPIMMDRFKAAVKEGWYNPKSVKLTRYDSMRVPNKELRSNPYFMAAAQSYVGYHSFNEDKRNA